jgi:hypothetical protein
LEDIISWASLIKRAANERAALNLEEI